MDPRKWRIPWSLVLALGLGLPGLASVRFDGTGAPGVRPPLAIAGTPDGGWADAWGSTVQTVAQLEAASLDAALSLLAGLAAVVWITGLAGYLLGRLRDVASRRGEWALRSAVGAPAGRLRRELMARGLLDLARAIGPALGLAAGVGFLVLRFAPGRLVATVDVPALLFSPACGTILLVTGVVVVVAPIFALPPAVRLRRPVSSAARALRSDLVGALSVLQIGCALGVAACAVMLARAAPGELARAGAMLPHARDTIVLRAHLPHGLSADERSEAWTAARQRVTTLAGVEAATVTSPGGLLGVGPVDTGRALCFTCVGGGLAMPVTTARARHIAVDGSYFELLGLEGTPPRGHDVVIDAGLRRRWFQGADPVGDRAMVRGRTALLDLRPIVADLAEGILPVGAGAGPPADSDAATGTVYLSLASAAPRVADVGLRLAAGGSGHRTTTVQANAARAIESIVPGVRLDVLGTLDSVVEAEVDLVRWLARLVAGLASGACVLGLIGVARAMAERIRLRRAEIGLRRVVGARRSSLIRLVLADAGRLASAGCLCGLALAASAGRGLPDVLPAILPLPPATALALVVLYAAAALAGSLLSTREALALDPVAALHG